MGELMAITIQKVWRGVFARKLAHEQADLRAAAKAQLLAAATTTCGKHLDIFDPHAEADRQRMAQMRLQAAQCIQAEWRAMKQRVERKIRAQRAAGESERKKLERL